MEFPWKDEVAFDFWGEFFRLMNGIDILFTDCKTMGYSYKGVLARYHRP